MAREKQTFLSPSYLHFSLLFILFQGNVFLRRSLSILVLPKISFTFSSHFPECFVDIFSLFTFSIEFFLFLPGGFHFHVEVKSDLFTKVRV